MGAEPECWRKSLHQVRLRELCQQPSVSLLCSNLGNLGGQEEDLRLSDAEEQASSPEQTAPSYRVQDLSEEILGGK